MPVPLPSRSTLALLGAQFSAGTGAKFHSVALSLYVLAVAGLTGVGGFVASGLIGSAAAVAVAAVATRYLRGATTMRIAAVVLTVVRLTAYVLIAAGMGAGALMLTQFVGSIAGTVLNNCSKAQAPADRRARVLAWMGVSNGVGGIAGAAAAGLVSAAAPIGVLIAVGATGALTSTAPMMVLSRRTVTAPVPLGEQWHAARRVLGPIAVGGLVFATIAMFELLKTGLVADLHGARWVGPATAVGVAGSWAAAATIERARPMLTAPRWPVVWPLLGTVALTGWAVADLHLVLLLGACAATGLLQGWLATSVETVVLARAGNVGPAALTFSGTGAAAASTVTVTLAPSLLDTAGFLPVAGAGAAVLLTAAAVAACTVGRRVTRTRSHAAAAA